MVNKVILDSKVIRRVAIDVKCGMLSEIQLGDRGKQNIGSEHRSGKSWMEKYVPINRGENIKDVHFKPFTTICINIDQESIWHSKNITRLGDNFYIY